MLGNSALWATATRCHALLEAANIPHAVVGGVAVCLHGYQRNTIDLNLLIRREDADGVRRQLGDAGFEWNEDRHEFTSDAGIPVQFLYAAERTGTGSPVLLPDPADRSAVMEVEGIPVLTLARLIEAKMECGEANLRRTHKDFADVVELISIHRLDGSFARFVHKSLRKTFRELVKRAGSTE